MFGESYSPWDSYMLIAQKSPALKKCEEGAQDEEDLALAWHSSYLFVYFLQRPEEHLCSLDHMSTEMLESDSRLKEHDLMLHELMGSEFCFQEPWDKTLKPMWFPSIIQHYALYLVQAPPAGIQNLELTMGLRYQHQWESACVLAVGCRDHVPGCNHIVAGPSSIQGFYWYFCGAVSGSEDWCCCRWSGLWSRSKSFHR